MINKRLYLLTNIFFYSAKFIFFVSSMILFRHFILHDEYFGLLLAILFLYSSMVFYGFEIRYKKTVGEDAAKSIYKTLYKDLNRKERRKILKRIIKK